MGQRRNDVRQLARSLCVLVALERSRMWQKVFSVHLATWRGVSLDARASVCYAFVFEFYSLKELRTKKKKTRTHKQICAYGQSHVRWSHISQPYLTSLRDRNVCSVSTGNGRLYLYTWGSWHIWIATLKILFQNFVHFKNISKKL